MTTRDDYWKKQIAFDCPLTKNRHTIEECFKKCQENSKEYVEERGRAVPYLYCLMDDQERFLHNGKIRRDL